MFHSKGRNQMLIYNRNRDYSYEGELTKDVEKLLRKRQKAYFKAVIVGTGFEIHEEVKTQNW